MSKHKFQTEVNQLLQLIIHSLYSHKEIFLRELISNSSDALGRLKLLTLTDDNFKQYSFEPKIDIFIEKDLNVLIVSDNGIGMNGEDLEENLGTIARSGTKMFLEKLSGNEKKDANLIGQFGVGFYSAFMVSEKIEVISRKASEEKAYVWISEGKGEFEITEGIRESAGTTVKLYLNEEGKEYLSRYTVENLVKKYSNHIPFPIFLHFEEADSDSKDKKPKSKIEQINLASALWRKSKSEIKEKDYNDFYKEIFNDYEDPFLYIHTQAEGLFEYTTLFFIPSHAPFDMYYADYKAGVKLYINRVFITDDHKELMPTYLRFLRGIIDSQDLPLNVSREILQHNKVLSQIRSASVKKVLDEIKKISEDKEKYEKFYKEFGRPLKEGLVQDFENKDILLELARFHSIKHDSLISLNDYVTGMKPDQKAIYYITGNKELNLKNSPLIEVYKSKDIDVLIMDDEIDELIMPSINKYKEFELKSVNRSDASEDLKTTTDKESEKEVTPLIKRMKDVLKDDVKDVIASARLSDSPSCIVADKDDPTIQMQHLLKSMGKTDFQTIKPILEINPKHPIIMKLQNLTDATLFENITRILLEQALLVEGAKLKDPFLMAKRMNSIIEKSL